MSQELKRGLRHAHIPGLNETIMSTGIAVNCKLVEKVTENLFFHCLGTRIAHLSTPAGTDLWVEIRDNKWVRCGCDLSKPGVWGNLPGGELMTYAHTATGVLVVDGFIGDHWDRPAGTAPLTIHLERGRAKEVYCADEKFLYEFIAYLHQDGNSDRLAEFAIGTNMGVIAPIGGLVQVEKMGGTVHVAFGDGYGDETGCPWESAAHVDLVVLKPTLRVFLDTGYEKTLIFNGVFMPGIVP
jgi:leucyl aminopeptidase (aminopeptidase T)